MTGVPGAIETGAAIRAGRTSAEEVCALALSRIDDAQPRLNAFVDVFHERALEMARAVDTRLRDGEELGPIAGVPVALKDNICVQWGRTTCGSRMLERYRSPYNATAVRRLVESGVVIACKTNMDEFAMGSSCEHSAFGCVRNPWDTDRVPGGSSGGSAAAVASGAVPLALGSDTGGSIRQPASLCGIVGLKPTYGRVSRYGLVAYASSLDQIGPMGRSVGDVASALSIVAGCDAFDATSSERPVPDFTGSLDEPIDGLRLGVPRLARSAENHPAIADALSQAIVTWERLGAEIVEIDLPHAGHGIAAYYIVAPAEASSNLARFDGVRYGHRAALGAEEGLEELYRRSRSEGFGHEVRRRILLGTHVLSSGYYDAYYNTALKARRLIKRDYDQAFASDLHAILMPTSPSPAFRIGEKVDDPLALYLEDVYTVGVNLAGLPAISLPAGFAEEGSKRLPVGVQLVGQAFGEADLLRIARMFEAATDWGGLVAMEWGGRRD